MADYHAVLMRTLDGLGETTPQLRARLYERARATIGRQLESTNPPMDDETIATHKAHLEAAIASIESQYPATETDAPPQIPEVQDPPETAQPATRATMPEAEFDTAPVEIPAAEEETFDPVRESQPVKVSGRRLNLAIIALGLLIVGGGATALWANRTSLVEVYNQFVSGDADMAKSGGEEASQASVSTVKKDKDLSASTIAEVAGVKKFGQRLNDKGEEVIADPVPESTDTLPVGVEPSAVTTTRIVIPDASQSPSPGEASEVTPPVTAQSTDQRPQTQPAGPVAIVAQKGFLYEEGASREQNTIDVGTVVWSIIQESPGNDLPIEPAIRAKVEINSRNLVLIMTIKRNADTSLPASHLIELVFTVPDDFIGGSIDRVQRFVFKESEEARGEALVGVPATIADGIFLIALNNLPQAVERNELLMRGRQWIDIPLGYATGRRALITLEKGIPGERVFDEAFAAWDKIVQ